MSDVEILKSMYDRLGEVSKELEKESAHLQTIPVDHDFVRSFQQKKVDRLADYKEEIKNDINTFYILSKNDTKNKMKNTIKKFQQKYTNVSKPTIEPTIVTNGGVQYAYQPKTEDIPEIIEIPEEELDEEKDPELFKEYEAHKTDNIKPVNLDIKSNNKAKRIAAGILASTLLTSTHLAGTNLSKKFVNQNNSNKKNEQIYNNLNLAPSLKDVTNQKEVEKRVIYLIATYPDTYGQFTKEELSNLILIANGELPSDYEPNNDTISEYQNLILSICNLDSPSGKYTNTPLSYIFVDESNAKKNQTILDSQMDEIVHAINNNDIEGFKKATIEWAETCRDITVLDSFSNKELTNLLSSPSGSFEIACIFGKYTPIIYEFSLMNGIKDIKIPFSINENNEVQYITIDEMFNRINTEPINTLPRYSYDSFEISKPYTVTLYEYTEEKLNSIYSAMSK